MIVKLKYFVVDGKHNGNEVPILGDAYPKGATLGYVTNGTIVLAADQGKMTDSEKRAYVDNGYTRVWGAGGGNIYGKSVDENWIEISHLAVFVEEPVPVPVPEPDNKLIKYRFRGLSFKDGLVITVENVA